MAATWPVTTSDELVTAVAAAGPGDLIELANGRYPLTGPLVASAAGTASAPIRLAAAHPHGATIVAAPGAEEALRLSGPFWKVEGVDLEGGAYNLRLSDAGSDVVVQDVTLRDAARAGVRADCGGPAMQPHCDRGRLIDLEVTRSTPGGDCSFAGVEIVGGLDWTIRGLWVHGVVVDTLACPAATPAGLLARGNAQRLNAEALVLDGVAYGVWLGPASSACEVRDTTKSGAGCTPPTLCAVQGAAVRNALLVNGSDAGARFENACGAALHNVTTWNDGQSVELQGSGTVDVANVLLCRPVVAGPGTTQTGGGNLLLAAPADASPFLDAAHGNFRLVAGAVAIDRGVSLTDVTADLDGVPRPQGSAYDVGAYEWAIGGSADGGVADGGRPDGGAGRGTIGGGGGNTEPPRARGCQCHFATAPGPGGEALIGLGLALLAWRRRCRTP